MLGLVAYSATLYDLALLGAIVRFSDDTPRPPERHRKKLAAWEHRNSTGRLIRKQPERRAGNTVISASITLHAGDYGGGGGAWCFVSTAPSLSTAT